SREIDEDFVQDLAATFRSNQYEVKPVLRSLFNSEHFYSDQSMASLIKSPVELAVSTGRLLSVQALDLRYVLSATESIGQTLFSPPNVAGWPGQRVWISPTTFFTRNTFSQSYVQGGLFSNPDSRRSPIQFDSLKFARSFGIDDASGLAQAIVDHLLRMPLSTEALNGLFPALIGSADPSDWSLEYPGAGRMVAEFIAQIVRLPEFHLN
ncbi:DUF1800 family protein, partial [bacterium]|nr:DUF1800 family protein [bacterium]